MGLEDILTNLGLDRTAAVSVPPGQRAYAPDHGPDSADNSQSFSLASGTPLDVPLGFTVGSVIIDNNTSAYLNVPDATKDGTGRWVGPGQPGAFPILGHISRGRIQWSAPPGKSQPALVPGEAAQIVFLASPVPLGFGSAAPSFQSLPWLTPNKPVIFKQQVGIGNIVVVAPVAGQNVWVFGGILDVYLAAAGGFAALTDDLGNVLAQVHTDSLVPVPFSYAGVSVGIGRGLKLSVVVAAANAELSLSYSQA